MTAFRLMEETLGQRGPCHTDATTPLHDLPEGEPWLKYVQKCFAHLKDAPVLHVNALPKIHEFQLACTHKCIQYTIQTKYLLQINHPWHSVMPHVSSWIDSGTFIRSILAIHQK